MAKTEEKHEDLFVKAIGSKEKRKLKSIRGNKQSIWSGLGMFGMVGWSVAVPTIGGVLLGLWLDKHFPQSFSWTLSMLILGIFTGCIIAWIWVSRENKEMSNDQDHNKDE